MLIRLYAAAKGKTIRAAGKIFPGDSPPHPTTFLCVCYEEGCIHALEVAYLGV